METDGFARRERGIEAHFDADDGVLGIGCKVDVIDVTLAACFEVGRLPDATHVAIALLAAETLVVGGVVGHDDEVLGHIVEAGEVPGDLDFEGRIAALVGGDVSAVEVDLGVPVAGTDDEEDAPIAPRTRDEDVAGIVAAVAIVGYAREGRAPAEGDGDLLVEGGGGAILGGILATLGVEGELPGAVEVDPVGTLEVGTRVFGERDGLSEDAGREGG